MKYSTDSRAREKKKLDEIEIIVLIIALFYQELYSYIQVINRFI